MSDQTATTQRVLRVFVSSTFQDMQRERDELMKYTFPALRHLCAQRGVLWDEVDLRWGITDEQKAEGQVLSICLEEICRCRPYFIGILGEHYGWVPEAIAPEVIQREPWLREHLEHSVTELEILHGVLRAPGQAQHAFFYFRDPKYIDTLPPEQHAHLGSPNADSADKLARLKERIRQSGVPVRDGYRDPRMLGRAVRRDLTRVINHVFPAGSLADPLNHEAAEHEAYAYSRARVYIRRTAYFEKLDRHAAGDWSGVGNNRRIGGGQIGAAGQLGGRVQEGTSRRLPAAALHRCHTGQHGLGGDGAAHLG